MDSEFVDRSATGYREYREEAMKWTPERVEQFTGVSRCIFQKVGESLITHRPAAFMIGLGLQKSMQGAEAARAVSLLPALLGYHRGFHYSDSKGRFVDWSYVSSAGLSQNRGEVVNQVSIGDRLDAGEFKFVFVLGTNPTLTLPNQSAVRRGLERKDVFVVVQDTHWSESTAYADVVLPSATYLEKTDIHFSDHHHYCRLSRKAIEPIGESRHEIWVMQELAARLELEEEWLFED